jgi:hypothetical protein
LDGLYPIGKVKLNSQWVLHLFDSLTNLSAGLSTRAQQVVQWLLPNHIANGHTGYFFELPPDQALLKYGPWCIDDSVSKLKCQLDTRQVLGPYGFGRHFEIPNLGADLMHHYFLPIAPETISPGTILLLKNAVNDQQAKLVRLYPEDIEQPGYIWPLSQIGR